MLIERRRSASSLLARRLLTWHRRAKFVRMRAGATLVARSWRGYVARKETKRLFTEQKERKIKQRAARAAAAAQAERESATKRAALADRKAKEAAVAAAAAATRVAEAEAEAEHRFRSESSVEGVEAPTMSKARPIWFGHRQGQPGAHAWR